VARNRVKRRLREIVRRDVLPRLENAGVMIDVLVRARREAYAAPFAELRQELEQWTDRRLSRARSSS
jgi:ribonuclease P protein component